MSTKPGPLAQRIAAELRAELGRQNVSRRWLADQIGQSHVNVSRWVNGDGGLSFDALDSICKVLGVGVADILARADQAATPNPRPRRARRSARSAGTVVTGADNNHAPGRDTHRLLAPALAA